MCLWENTSSGASDVTILDWNSQLKNSHNLKVESFLFYLVGLLRTPAEELMLLNCGVGEDS